MKKLLAPMMATALILAAGTAAFAADTVPTPDAKPHPRVDRFKEADANGDGFITKDEMKAQQDKRLNEMFEKTDTNKDGKLSKEEMKAGREAMRQKWKDHKDAKEGGPGGPPPGGPDAPPPEDK